MCVCIQKLSRRKIEIEKCHRFFVVFRIGFLGAEAKMGEDYAMYMKDHAMATVGSHRGFGTKFVYFWYLYLPFVFILVFAIWYLVFTKNISTDSHTKWICFSYLPFILFDFLPHGRICTNRWARYVQTAGARYFALWDIDSLESRLQFKWLER